MGLGKSCSKRDGCVESSRIGSRSGGLGDRAGEETEDGQSGAVRARTNGTGREGEGSEGEYPENGHM